MVRRDNTPREPLPRHEPVPPTDRGHPVYLTRGEWMKHLMAMILQILAIIVSLWFFSVQFSAAIEKRFTRLEVNQEHQVQLLKETRDDVKELRRDGQQQLKRAQQQP